MVFKALKEGCLFSDKEKGKAKERKVREQNLLNLVSLVGKKLEGQVKEK